MGVKTIELIAVLDELHLLASNDGQGNWADWIIIVKTKLENSDFSGIEYLLDAYAGMGSLNDTYIQSSPKLDRKFSDLKTKAWELANHIKRNHEINT